MRPSSWLRRSFGLTSNPALTANERIVLQAGTHTTTMAIRYADYVRLVKPVIADLTREPVKV